MQIERPRIGLAAALILLWASPPQAQVTTWQLGGGLPWSEADTASVMIDFEGGEGAIQPIYITPDQNIISLLGDWSRFRVPNVMGEFDFMEGERPRIWKWLDGRNIPTESGLFLVDGDSTTYNTASTQRIDREYFTIDLAVPVPAHQFGFFTPPRGFRSDGTSLVDDFVPAFIVSVQEEPTGFLSSSNIVKRRQYASEELPIAEPLKKIVADVRENFDPQVHLDFPRQHVRFIRYAAQLTLLDLEAQSRLGNLAIPLHGSIADFELFGEGVPKRAVYRSRIIDLGQEQNFGRLFFAATPMRMVDGVSVEAPDAQAVVEIEVRTGRDDDPNVYHEFIVTGQEKAVSLEHYENLMPRMLKRCSSCEFVVREPRPGMQASIGYDSENWSFWSTPFTESGQPLLLISGSYIQLKITFQSSAFDDFVRLDSLWIEQAPLLAREVMGEVARLDEPQPLRGYAEVELGEMTDFVYDVRAAFEGQDQPGFDALRIHTGSRPRFKYLEIGDERTEPQEVVEEERGLLIHLSERITRVTNRPLRVIFGTEVFDLATSFEGEVLDLGQETLPQPIIGGDVSDEVSTNSLRVLSISESAPEPVQDLRFSTPVLTPNGDGVNDELEIAYSLFTLPERVSAVLDVYALDGRRVTRIPLGEQNSGPQTIRWNGRDEDQALLAPGLYLVAVSIQAESSAGLKMRPVGIAY